MIDPTTWAIIDQLMQWLIMPAVALLWAFNGRLSKQEREILRILTILEERNHRRDEDREDASKLFVKLNDAIEKLADKLDQIVRDKT